MTNYEKKKKEAFERMKMIGLYGDARRKFYQSGRIYYSQRTRMGRNVFGILWELPKDLETKVKSFEEENNALVYHVIESITEFGHIYDFLHVSDYEEEWEREREELKAGHALSYCYNSTDDWCSEFGTIVIKESGGGLVRVA